MSKVERNEKNNLWIIGMGEKNSFGICSEEKGIGETCEKVSFDTKEEARERLFQIVENGHRKDHTPCRYYYCENCNKYHLTSKLNYKKY